MGKNAVKLYFVALIPPEEVFHRAQSLKELMADKYETKAALRSPPHITLHMPFKFREDREDRIVKALEMSGVEKESVSIKHDGFGAFPPRVIYINVEKTAELEQLRNGLVKIMRRELKLDNADYKDRPFHPHMTIAFRDLKKRIFPLAWQAFQDKPFSESWTADSINLLKHNGKTWDIYRQIHFVR